MMKIFNKIKQWIFGEGGIVPQEERVEVFIGDKKIGESKPFTMTKMTDTERMALNGEQYAHKNRN